MVSSVNKPSENVNNWIQETKSNFTTSQSKIKEGESLLFLVKDVLNAASQTEKPEWFISDAHRIYAMAGFAEKYQYTGLFGGIGNVASAVYNWIIFNKFENTAQILLDATKGISPPGTDLKSIPVDIKVEFGRYLDVRSLKSYIDRLLENQAIPQSTLSHLKALLLEKKLRQINHGLTKETVFKLLPECKPYLEHLNLVGLELTRNELEEILNCPHLKQLNFNKILMFNDLVNDVENAEKKKQWRGLYNKNLIAYLKGDWKSQTVINKETLMKALINPEIFSQIREININLSKFKITTEEFRQIFVNCKELRKINLLDCEPVFGCLESIPNGVKELNLRFSIKNYSNRRNVPTLTDVKIRKLPLGLTHLTADLFGKQPLSNDIFQNFPNLTFLEVYDLRSKNMEIFKHLPQGVKKIHYHMISNSNREEWITDGWFRSLPKDLEELGLYGFDKIETTESTSFPPSLVKMSLDDTPSYQGLQHWPKTVRHVYLTENEDYNFRGYTIPNLPDSVTKLTLEAGCYLSELRYSNLIGKELEVLEIKGNPYAILCCEVDVPNLKTIILFENVKFFTKHSSYSFSDLFKSHSPITLKMYRPVNFDEEFHNNLNEWEKSGHRVEFLD